MNKQVRIVTLYQLKKQLIRIQLTTQIKLVSNIHIFFELPDTT